MKHKLYNILFLIILNTTIPIGLCQSQTLITTPLKTHFSPHEYYGGIQNWAFDQDSDGRIFVANNFGLLMFDGERWELLSVPFSTKLRAVKCHDNRIYIGGQGQIGYFTKGTGGHEFISLIERLPENERQISETWKIELLNNKIYFNTNDRLLVLDEENFYVQKLPHSLQRILVHKNELYIQLTGQGIFKSSEGELTKLSGSDIMTEDLVGIHSLNGQDFFVLANGRTFLLDSIISEIDSPLKTLIINASLKLESGSIAFGTQNHGLIILNQDLQIIQRLSHNSGTSNRTVLSIHEDDFQNLWLGLHNGIDYLEVGSPISMIGEELGLEGTGYSALKYKGSYYLGTNNGLFIQSNSSEKYELVAGTEGQVYNISQVGGEAILCHHDGAFQISDNLKRINETGSWKFKEIPNSNSILGGDYEGMAIYRNQGGQIVKTKGIPELKESSRIFEFENDSTLWMTHGYKGAYRLKFNNNWSNLKELEHFGVENGFPSNQLISVYKIDNQLLFTAETGVYDFNAKTNSFELNTFLRPEIGMSHVSKMVSNESGDIYFIENGKIGLLKKESFGTYTKETNVFKRVNKYLSDDLENIHLLDERNIVIGAKQGFIHFDPSKDFQVNPDFRALINEVQITESDSTYSLFVPFSKKDFEYTASFQFLFSSPYFDGFDDIQYSYRLNEGEWSNWSESSFKEYSSLNPGNYTFEVKALNIYGNESIPATVNFTIKHPWYSSPFAIISYFIFGLVLFTALPFFQRKKHKKEKVQLEQDKHRALKDKDLVIDEITEKSNKELQSLRNEKLQTEISHKNSQLSSVTTHLLQKNELLKEIQKSIETSTDGKPSSDLKKVIRSIERNLSDDESWDQFAFHFDQVHGDFLKKLSSEHVKLTPQETKLAAYLRMNMTSKEIASLMNISVRGVELARYRLRKKIGLERDQNLTEYLMEIR